MMNSIQKTLNVNTLCKFEYFFLGFVLVFSFVSILGGIQFRSYILAVIPFYLLFIMPGQLLLKILGNQVKEESNISGSFTVSLAVLSPFVFAFYFFKGSMIVFLWFIWILNFCMYIYCIIKANSEGLHEDGYLFSGGRICLERDRLYTLFAYVLVSLFSIAVFITARYQQFGADSYSHISNIQHIINSNFIPVSGGPLYRNSPDPVYSMNLLFMLYAATSVIAGLKGFEIYILSSAFLCLIHFRTILYLCGTFDVRNYAAQIMLGTIFFYYIIKSIQYKYAYFINLCEPGVVYSCIILPFALGFMLRLFKEKKPGKGALILCGLILASSSAIHMQHTIHLAISLFSIGVCILIYNRLWEEHWRKFLLLFSLFVLFSLPYMLYRLSVIDTYSLIKGNSQIIFIRSMQFPFGSITFFDLRTYFTFGNIIVLTSVGYILFNKHRALQKQQKQILFCFSLLPFFLFIPYTFGNYVMNTISISLLRRFSSLHNMEFLVIFAIALFVINNRFFLKYRKVFWVPVLITIAICITILIEIVASQLKKDISRYDMYRISKWNITRKLIEVKDGKSYFGNWQISDVFSAFVPDFSANGRFWLTPDGLQRVDDFYKLLDFSVQVNDKSQIIKKWNTGFLLFDRKSYAEFMAETYLYRPCKDNIEDITGHEDTNFGLYRIIGDIDKCNSIQTSTKDKLLEKHVKGFNGIEQIKLDNLYDVPSEEHFDWLVDGNTETHLTWKLGKDVAIEVIPTNKGKNSSYREFGIVFSPKHRLFKKIVVFCIDAEGRRTIVSPKTEIQPYSRSASYLLPQNIKIIKISVYIQGDRMSQVSIAEVFLKENKDF